MRWIVALAVIGLTTTAASKPSVIPSMEDRDRIDNLVVDAVNLLNELIDTGRAIMRNERDRRKSGSYTEADNSAIPMICLTHMSLALATLRGDIHALGATIDIAVLLHEAVDKQETVAFSRMLADQTADLVPLVRQAANQAMDGCQENAFVVAEGRRLLDFLGKTDGALIALSAKIGHAPESLE